MLIVPTKLLQGGVQFLWGAAAPGFHVHSSGFRGVPNAFHVAVWNACNIARFGR